MAWEVNRETEDEKETRTCSSSTLAARGRASDARTIMVERTMAVWRKAGVSQMG
jgi:hypothetical protein